MTVPLMSPELRLMLRPGRGLASNAVDRTAGVACFAQRLVSMCPRRRTRLTKRWSAAVLILSVVGVGQAGEKDIIERLENARAIVVILEGETHASSVMIRNQNADADLAELCELPGLEMLILNGTKLTDVGMRTVGDLTGLRCLDLNGTAITDAGLKEIKKPPPTDASDAFQHTHHGHRAEGVDRFERPGRTLSRSHGSFR